MITDWILDVASGFVGWFLGLFPADYEVPDWLAGFADLANQVFANGAGLGAWVPWPIVLAVVGTIVAFWLIGLVIKFARWLVGLIPTMGGG